MSNNVENGSTNGKFFDLKHMAHLVKPLDRRQRVAPTILETIGHTPLVKLEKIPKEEGIECDIYAKCEYLNPGGSVKDRIAYRMIHDAEERGILNKSSVIIEPTAGNTGIGLALAAAVKGYRCIIVLPEKMSNEKVNTLKALGAEIIRTPTGVPSNSPESDISVAHRLATEIPGGIVLDQFNNPSNPLAHYDGTAEEILWSLDDDIDMVVLGAGTSGTISGIGNKIKERCPKCVVVGVDPYGSILAQPDSVNVSDITFYEVEGVGYDFRPAVLDWSVIDKWVKTKDEESLRMARRLIKEEGLLCGGSSGSAMWGAMQAAKTLKKGQKCVVLLPDSIRNYMTKFVTDQWMEARGFQPVVKNDQLWWWENKVSEKVVQKIPSISVKSSPKEALDAMRELHVPLLTVVDDKGSLAGVFTADHARHRITNLGSSPDNDDLKKFIERKFYHVELWGGSTLGLVSRMLDMAPFVVVVKRDVSNHKEPIGIITSQDLLMNISTEKPLNGK